MHASTPRFAPPNGYARLAHRCGCRPASRCDASLRVNVYAAVRVDMRPQSVYVGGGKDRDSENGDESGGGVPQKEECFHPHRHTQRNSRAKTQARPTSPREAEASCTNQKHLNGRGVGGGRAPAKKDTNPPLMLKRRVQRMYVHTSPLPTTTPQSPFS